MMDVIRVLVRPVTFEVDMKDYGRRHNGFSSKEMEQRRLEEVGGYAANLNPISTSHSARSWG
jgi:hypothetical protein